MKNSLLVLLIVLGQFGLLNLIIPNAKQLNKNEKSKCYKIYKIDSLNNYYLFYAKGKDSLFKIVSKKDTIVTHSKVKISSCYDFILISLRDNPPKIFNNKISEKNYLDINCFAFDDSTFICTEGDSINDIHFAKNLKGMYYLDNF